MSTQYSLSLMDSLRNLINFVAIKNRWEAKYPPMGVVFNNEGKTILVEARAKFVSEGICDNIDITLCLTKLNTLDGSDKYAVANFVVLCIDQNRRISNPPLVTTLEFLFHLGKQLPRSESSIDSVPAEKLWIISRAENLETLFLKYDEYAFRYGGYKIFNL